MVQIRNHHPKSEVLIQSETALNAGERGSFDGSIGSNTSKRTQRCTVFLDTRTSSRHRLQYSRRNRIAQILEGCQSLLQYYYDVQMARWVSYKWDPTLHYKMKAKRLWWIWLKGLQTRYEYRDPRYVTPAQKQKQTVVSVDREHRDGFRQSEA